MVDGHGVSPTNHQAFGDAFRFPGGIDAPAGAAVRGNTAQRTWLLKVARIEPRSAVRGNPSPCGRQANARCGGRRGSPSSSGADRVVEGNPTASDLGAAERSIDSRSSTHAENHTRGRQMNARERIFRRHVPLVRREESTPAGGGERQTAGPPRSPGPGTDRPASSGRAVPGGRIHTRRRRCLGVGSGGWARL